MNNWICLSASALLIFIMSPRSLYGSDLPACDNLLPNGKTYEAIGAACCDSGRISCINISDSLFSVFETAWRKKIYVTANWIPECNQSPAENTVTKLERCEHGKNKYETSDTIGRQRYTFSKFKLSNGSDTVEYFCDIGIREIKCDAQEEGEFITLVRDWGLNSKKTWSKSICKAIAEKKVKLGMTEAQVLKSWGRPSDVNRTITAAGTMEQWVYGTGSYLYFADDILTTIQN